MADPLETEKMREQAQMNKQIEKDLKQDRKRNKEKHKILLLGCGEAGKVIPY